MRCLIITIVLCTISLNFWACSNSTGGVGDPSPHEEVLLSFVDEQGNDRLDPNHSSPFTESNLEIYYLKDGKKERVFEGNLDYPKNFKLYISEGEEHSKMMLWISNHVEEDGHTKTLIEFPGGTTDTVTMEPLNEPANSARKLWYDGELVWMVDSDYTMPIEITKPVTAN